MKKKRWLGISPLVFLFVKASPAWAAVIDGVPTLGEAENIVGRLLSKALPLLGLAVGAMVIVGGFQLLTSGGNKEGAQKAQNTFTYAIWGLILAIIAWFILVFVREFTGINVTQFVIP